MNDTKKRNMTGRGFLHKASGKVSAIAFLTQHREWLTTGDLAPLTLPILIKLDSAEIMATPALESIKCVVLGHMMAKDAVKAENAIINPPKEKKSTKPWIATIYDAKGDIQFRLNGNTGEPIELQESFDTSSAADNWTDRRLVEGASDWFGVVAHTSVLNKFGEPLATTVMRDDAMSRTFRINKGAVCKVKSKTTPTLGFGVKCSNDRSVFSKG